jgi:hypothetical protein
MNLERKKCKIILLIPSINIWSTKAAYKAENPVLAEHE